MNKALAMLGRALSGAGRIPQQLLGRGNPGVGNYLRGDGSWALVSPGALSLIATGTPSAQATLDFVNVFTGTYDAYLVVFDLLPATDNVNLQILFGTGATPTWQTASYNYADLAGNGGGALGDGAMDVGYIALPSPNTGFDGYRVSSTSTLGIFGSAQIIGPASTTRYKTMIGDAALMGSGNTTNFYRHMFGGVWKSATAVTSLRFKFSSGNITSGKVRIYGISNT